MEKWQRQRENDRERGSLDIIVLHCQIFPSRVKISSLLFFESRFILSEKAALYTSMKPRDLEKGCSTLAWKMENRKIIDFSPQRR